MRSVTIYSPLVATILTVSTVFANVLEGDLAPLFSSVDEEMRATDLADFVDGAPLVFLYGSAT